jgi:hypothetical protein
MSKENKEEKLFNEVVDHILAGESVQTDIPDNDLRSAIEFAKKIKELRASPTEPFKTNLKARLLQELREKETRTENKGLFRRAFSRRIVWQLATTVAVIIIAIGITWRAGYFQPDDITNLATMPPKANDGGVIESVPGPTLMATPGGTGTDTTVTGTFGVSRIQAVIQANAITDKSAYLPGEAVNIKIYLTNDSPDSVEIQPFPQVMITDTNGEAVYISGAGIGVVVIQPGETYSYEVPWDMNNNTAIPGMYYITVANIIDDDNNIEVSNAANGFEIKE